MKTPSRSLLCVAQKSPIDVRTHVFARDSAARLALDRDTKVGTELLFCAARFSDITLGSPAFAGKCGPFIGAKGIKKDQEFFHMRRKITER